jgi:hypothetical protein
MKHWSQHGPKSLWMLLTVVESMAQQIKAVLRAKDKNFKK